MLSACTKQYSDESTGRSNASAFALCSGGVPIGEFVKASELDEDSYVLATIDFKTTGYYYVHTDTVNGMYFSMDNTGYNFGEGTQQIKLAGHGIPKDSLGASFKIYFNGTPKCGFDINVLSSTRFVGIGSDYLPLTAGSYITFDTVDDALPRDTVQFKVTDKIRKINGMDYTLTVSTKRDSNYFSKNGNGEYFRAYNLFGTLINYKCLDDRLPEGSSWESAEFNGIVKIGQLISPFIGKVVTRIEKRNIKYVLSNQTSKKKLNNVIRVVSNILTRQPQGDYNTGTNLSGDTSCFAKNIGLVYYNFPSAVPPLKWKANGWNLK